MPRKTRSRVSQALRKSRESRRKGRYRMEKRMDTMRQKRKGHTAGRKPKNRSY